MDKNKNETNNNYSVTDLRAVLDEVQPFLDDVARRLGELGVRDLPAERLVKEECKSWRGKEWSVLQTGKGRMRIRRPSR